MPAIKLSLRAEFLSQEYVLVQAWKKAHDYIRRHNWYADVLELDLTNADLEERLRAIAAELMSADPLRPEPMRLVLAPKSQAWDVKNGEWLPVEGPRSVETRLRPLAHVSVRDQIIGTTFLILLSDAIETRQGDPRGTLDSARKRGVVSYGHRLFCDEERGRLSFRWGNAVVYRQYFQDYQAFISRPKQVVDVEFRDSTAWAIVYADLSQFYDRVRPAVLFKKIKKLLGPKTDARLLASFQSFFDWNWHPADQTEARRYAQGADPQIEGFDHVALPQGLVASGFFSNAVLIEFDEAVWSGRNQWHDNNSWQLVDYCRYVDDMRFVVRLGADLQDASEGEIADKVCGHLIGLLSRYATGMVLNPKKCAVILGRDAAAGSIPVSATMKRVNQNTSGAIDLIAGEETIDLIEGLFSFRQEEPLDFEDKFRDTFFAAKPDVRDETVARFAANRFRKTFRALRPLCVDDPDEGYSLLPPLSRESLDSKAVQFCRRLIERWVRDPSNMRLLRVALDVYPDERAVDLVLHVLQQYVEVGKRRKAPRRVAWYCAAELLKAGATETGLVGDSDCLPAGISLLQYQEKLIGFAEQIVARRNTYPWYLEQQALLFLACAGKFVDRQVPKAAGSYLKDYIRLHHALSNKTTSLRREDIVPFALLQKHLQSADAASRTFLACFREVQTPTQRTLLLRVLQEDAELAEAIRSEMTSDEQVTWNHLYYAHGVTPGSDFPTVGELPATAATYPLLSVARSPLNPFQQEYAALHFALALLETMPTSDGELFPARIRIRSTNWRALCGDQFPIRSDTIAVELENASETDGRYSVPSWISAHDAWKYRLGQTLRVLLTGQADYTAPATRSQRENSLVLYSPYRSSWFRRRYGLFNGRHAFGPNWLPISSWLGSLLSRLLEWPGFVRTDRDFTLPEDFGIDTLRQLIRDRLGTLERLYGRASSTPILPLRTPKAFGRDRPPQDGLYKMRIGVVQTAVPRRAMFDGDPQLGNPPIRFQHRRHLAAILGAVHRMLQVRETHCEAGAGIELLVFPELSVHPDDIRTHLVPFAMQHRCIIFAGVVFHPRTPGDHQLVNSGYWIIPVQDSRGSLHIEYVEQGKWHLTAEERDYGICQFRPAQWLLQFINPANGDGLWAMTGAICYDSTDLRLAADLRDVTDMFIVPALNNDVGTFDNMAAALHYHMYQHVIVANSGEFGGSTGQAPFSDRHQRTIFHSHGNEQATVNFFEVDLNTYRSDTPPLTATPSDRSGNPPLKTPPAGYDPRTRRR